MSSLKAVPRNKLETDLDESRAAVAKVEAAIATIRTEMETRLSGPLAEVSKLRQRSVEIRSELQRREAADAIVPTVSDHALIRYIERVHGIPMEAIRQQILLKAENAIRLGAGAVRLEDCTLVIKGSTVVTVKADDKNLQPVKKLTRAQREQREAAE